MASLDQLQPGQQGRIAGIALPPADAQRFMEMGLTTRARIKVLKVAPLGDPIEILIRGYHLSLRKCEARLIDIDLVS